MQLSYSAQQIASFFKLTQDNFIICTGTNYSSIIKQNNRSNQALALLTRIINTLGQKSATSQNLKQIITTMNKFIGSNQRIYIKIEGNQAVGFVKTGEKYLFYRNIVGAITQMKPICVLDIYVHQTCQRNGYGKEIFQKFLTYENVRPQKLAYDRPSTKLISFLKKHYQLVEYVPQNNNYLVFNKYFENNNMNGASKIQFTNFGQVNIHKTFYRNKQNETLYKKQKQNKGEGKVADSLEILTQQVQRNKTRANTLLSECSSKIQTADNLKTDKDLNNFPQKSNVLEAHGRYSLNMKLRDLSYRVPWAIQGEENRNNIRKNSQKYGRYLY